MLWLGGRLTDYCPSWSVRDSALVDIHREWRVTAAVDNSGRHFCCFKENHPKHRITCETIYLTYLSVKKKKWAVVYSLQSYWQKGRFFPMQAETGPGLLERPRVLSNHIGQLILTYCLAPVYPMPSSGESELRDIAVTCTDLITNINMYPWCKDNKHES